MTTLLRAFAALVHLGLASACVVGPPYARPPVNTGTSFKELPPSEAAGAQWAPARPSDEMLRGNWWVMFNDPDLDALEARVDVGNQNIAEAAAAYLSARALVKQARSQYFPTVSTSPAVTSARIPIRQGTTIGASGPTGSFTEYSLPFDASWQPDLWGRVRSSTRAATAGAQASAGDLESVRLSVHGAVATTYFQLRTQDALTRLLASTVEVYQRALATVRAQFDGGITSDETVAQAETQLASAEAQLVGLGVARAQFEHALAVLIGEPPETFTLPPADLPISPQSVPVGLPSQLLERRPDIAAAERRMAQANAQIGVATSAFFPGLMLNAASGFESLSLGTWLSWPARFWSFGPQLAQTLFDGGARRAQVQFTQAGFDQAVATYRQTVLTAFQEVQDNLASVRILTEQIQKQDAATAAAERNLRLANVRYTAGLDPYLNVVIAQAALLSQQQAGVTLRLDQISANVRLIVALGGGWQVP